jgi:hypothetical protein
MMSSSLQQCKSGDSKFQQQHKPVQHKNHNLHLAYRPAPGGVHV